MVFYDLVEEDDVMLSASFSATEIRVVMATANGNKTPGPNDFNFSFFFKWFWDLIGGSGVMFDFLQPQTFRRASHPIL
jgi:hypothetical protein